MKSTKVTPSARRSLDTCLRSEDVSTPAPTSKMSLCPPRETLTDKRAWEIHRFKMNGCVKLTDIICGRTSLQENVTQPSRTLDFVAMSAIHSGLYIYTIHMLSAEVMLGTPPYPEPSSYRHTGGTNPTGEHLPVIKHICKRFAVTATKILYKYLPGRTVLYSQTINRSEKAPGYYGRCLHLLAFMG